MAEGVAQGAPDDFEQIGQAVMALSGGKPLLPRTYMLYTGPESVESILQHVEMLVQIGIPWDFVLCFRAVSGELADWTGLIRTIVQRFGSQLDALQITNEPNLKGVPGAADGDHPHILVALVQGVLAAREAVKECGATVQIGFSAVPGLPSDDFWIRLGAQGQSAFATALDYVGYDLYPGVFGPPVPPEAMEATVQALLRQLREVHLAAAGIPETVAIRITENGWPTGPDRSETTQAQVLETTIRTIHNVRETFHITHYEYFGLRDADSSHPNRFYRFGLLHDDYTPKPAFEIYRKLIAELG